MILPDTGRNYMGKLFSDRWMQEHGFREGTPTEPRTLGGALGFRGGSPPLVAVTPDDTLATALDKMHGFGISQLPVLEDNRSVGSLQESTLLSLVHDGLDFQNQPIRPVMGKPLPTLDVDTDVAEAYRLLLAGHNAVIATVDGRPHAVVSRIDLIDYFSRRSR